MKRSLILIAGVIGILVGFGFIMPAIALWRSGSPDTAMIFGPLLLGAVLLGAAALAVCKAMVRDRA